MSYKYYKNPTKKSWSYYLWTFCQQFIIQSFTSVSLPILHNRNWLSLLRNWRRAAREKGPDKVEVLDFLHTAFALYTTVFYPIDILQNQQGITTKATCSSLTLKKEVKIILFDSPKNTEN